LGFFLASAQAGSKVHRTFALLPKYLFSDAKLPASPAGRRFWRLVSEKNICVGIPKGINRGAL